MPGKVLFSILKNMIVPLGLPFQTDKDGRPVVDDKAGGIEYFTIGTGSLGPDSIQEATDPMGLPVSNKIDY